MCKYEIFSVLGKRFIVPRVIAVINFSVIGAQKHTHLAKGGDTVP